MNKGSPAIHVDVVGTRGLPGRQGGVEQHGEELYPRLVRQGRVRVKVYCRHPFFSRARGPAAWRGVDLVSLATFRQGGAEALWHSLVATLHALISSCQVVHFHNIGPALFCPLVRWRGKQVVVTYHSRNYLHKRWGLLGRTLLQLGERWTVRYAHRIISVSSAHVRFLEDRYGPSVAAKTTVIPNGVSRPPADAAAGDNVLERLGVRAGDYVLGVGRLVEEKGCLELVRAYQAAAKPPAHLVLVGDADYKTSYAQAIREAARDDPRIVLTGVLPRDQVWPLYRGTSLFALPSYQEGHPLALLEALRVQAPVVVSDLDTTRVLPLPAERFLPPGDIPAWTRALEAFANRPLPGEVLSAFDRLCASAYDWDAVAERTCRVYQEVLQG